MFRQKQFKDSLTYPSINTITSAMFSEWHVLLLSKENLDHYSLIVRSLKRGSFQRGDISNFLPSDNLLNNDNFFRWGLMIWQIITRMKVQDFREIPNEERINDTTFSRKKKKIKTYLRQFKLEKVLNKLRYRSFSS